MSSRSAKDLIRRWEGLRLKAYVCPAGVWTIGYGHTIAVKQGDVITLEQAENFLETDFNVARASSLALCPGLSGGRLEAITDFVFNLGAGRLKASTLRRKINAHQDLDVPSELRKWVWGGGKKLPGLVARREEEVKLWLSDTQDDQ